MGENNYVILSLKHSVGKTPCFWRPKNAGYTIYPWSAGIYTKEQVDADPNYYNDGANSLAIPLTEKGLQRIGFKCSYDPKQAKQLGREACHD